ncbi:hypothetical protein CCACVL1_13584 [Corchorus capsularis]|uniref:Uncharacterized protein n=1 Tax=Corchorus capsularis TaxID=210143 RepID=A0A1R3IAH7_COCAP|nr:hypothetical protein CCACVL1_13584 [Corchorus capsularis]
MSDNDFQRLGFTTLLSPTLVVSHWSTCHLPLQLKNQAAGAGLQAKPITGSSEACDVHVS